MILQSWTLNDKCSDEGKNSWVVFAGVYVIVAVASIKQRKRENIVTACTLSALC